MLLKAALISIPLLAQQVAGHAAIIRPWTRAPGDKSSEVCGSQFNEDRNGIPNANTKMSQIAEKDLAGNMLPADCNWRLCGGLQYDDNKDHVYTWEAGTEVPIDVFALNRHGGVANVSIVDTATNTVIGSSLKEWTDGNYLQYDFSNTCPSHPPLDEVSFNITIPYLGDKCKNGGDCVVQWYWYSEKANNQTFESCIDFVQPYEGSSPAAAVTDEPSTTSWYRYCSPYTTTIDYWNATASIPLAINTQYQNFATDVILTASAAASSISSFASSMAASITGSALLSNSGSQGGSSSSPAMMTSVSNDGSASAVVSSATSMVGSSATSSVADKEQAVSSNVVMSDAGSSLLSSAASVPTSIASMAVSASVETTSTSPVQTLAAESTKVSKTACRARTSTAVGGLNAMSASGVATADAVAQSASTADVQNAAAAVAETSSVGGGSCTETTVTVTETSTVTVYVEVVPVGTTTVLSQTLSAVQTNSSSGGMKRALKGRGAHKRRAAH